MKAFINFLFNAYCNATREGHVYQQFLEREATLGEKELAVEREVFQLTAEQNAGRELLASAS